MKTASKLLSMLLLVAMCLSLMGGSAYAGFDLGSLGGSSDETVQEQQVGDGGFTLGESGTVPESGSSESGTVPETGNSESTSVTVGSGNPGISTFGLLEPPTTGPVGGGSTSYTTVGEALSGGETSIVLSDNSIETANFTASKNVTIDLNGKGWNLDGYVFTIPAGVTVTVTDSVGIGNIGFGATMVVNGTLNLNLSGSVVCTAATGFSGNGQVNINGGIYDVESNFFGGSARVVVNRGEFDADPSGFLGSNSTATETSGVWTVTSTKAVASYGGDKFATIQAAIDAIPVNGAGTVTVIASEDDLPAGTVTVGGGRTVTLDMSAQEIKSHVTVNDGSLTLVNGGSAAGTITVKNGGTVTISGSGKVKFDTVSVEPGGKFISNGNADIATLNFKGDTLTINDGTFGSVFLGGSNKSIRGGQFTSLSGYYAPVVSGGIFDPASGVQNFLASGYTTTTLPNGNLQVVQASSVNNVVLTDKGIDSANTYYIYYLNANDGTSSSMRFTSTAVAASIVLRDTEGNSIALADHTDFSYTSVSGKYVYTLNLGNLAQAGTLRATRYTVEFSFADGVDHDQYIIVVPRVNASYLNYKDGNANKPTFVMTNAAPAGYSFTKKGSSSSTAMVAGTDYDVSADGKTITLKENFFKKSGSGTFYVNFVYTDGSRWPMGPVTVNTSYTGNGGNNGGNNGGSTPIPGGDVAIWPVDSNEWYSGDGMLAFYYRPAIDFSDPAKKGLWIDGWLQDPTNWITNSNSGLLKIGTAILNNLSRGWHTVSINTVDGVASCQFYVGATLRPVDTDKHVTGSSKNLQFVCSDPISRVWIGGTELTNLNYGDYWTLSSSRKTITLTAKFMNSQLVAGKTYDLYVQTDNGDRPSCSFQILTTAQASSSPRTGDESNLALWASVLVLAGGAAVAILPRLKKNEN